MGTARLGARHVHPVLRNWKFGPALRLTRRVDFERLLRNGVRRKVGGFMLYFERRIEGAPRLGILVTRQHAARATVRNSLKRCIREAFRLEQEAIGSVDVLVRPPYGARPGAAMIEGLRRSLSSLGG